MSGNHLRCPQCGHVLDGEFCPFCKDVPQYPPSRLESRRPHTLSFGVGEEPPRNLRRVYRYELPDILASGFLGTGDVIGWISEQLQNSVTDESGKHVFKTASEITEFALTLLTTSELVEKLDVIPTDWDEYREVVELHVAAIRTAEGRYFRLTDSAKAALKVALLAHVPTPLNWLYLAKVVITAGVAIRKIFDVLVVLDGDDRTVFEELYTSITQLSITGLTATPTLTQSSVLSTIGPTSEQLVQKLAGKVEERDVRDALERLQSKRVIKHTTDGWKITV